MQHDSHTYKTLKNAIFGFMGFAWPIIFAIFVTPVVVFRLGIENYGFFILLNTISSMLGLLDIGVGTAMVKYLAEYSGAGDRRGSERLIGTCNSFFLGTAAVGAAALLLIGLVARARLGANIESVTYFTCFGLAALIFLVNISAGVFFSVPTAVQRLDIGNKLGMLKLFLNSLTILVLLLSGFGLVSVLATTLAYDAVFVLVFWRTSRKLLPGVSFRLGWNRTEFRRSLKFGVVFFMSNWANTLLVQLDRLLIPFVLGPAQLTYYSLPGNVTTKIQGLNNSLAAVLFPMSSALQGSGDSERLKKMYVRAFRLLTVAAAGLSVTVIVFSHDILLYWLNADFAAKSRNILVILTATYFILSLSGPLNNFLLGLGRVRLLAGFSFLMMAVNMAALAVFLPRYGIEGAAWAYLVAVLPVGGLFWHTERNILKLENRLRAYLYLAVKNLICAGFIYVLVSQLLAGLVTGLWSLLAVFVFVFVLYFLVYAALGFFEREDRATFSEFFALIFKRFSGVWTRS